MPEWAQAALKWILTVAAMGLLVWVAVPRAFDALVHAVSLDMNGGGAVPEVTPPPAEEPETTSGEAAAVAAAGVRASALSALGPEAVTLGGDGAEEVLLAFEPVPTDPACLTEAHLEIAVRETSGQPEVRVQPARVADLTALEVGEPLPPDVAIDSGDPAAATAEEGADTLRFTVTAVYSIAAREAAADGDVVLSLTLVAEGDGTVTLASATGEAEDAPRLTWTAVEGCPEFAAPQDA